MEAPNVKKLRTGDKWKAVINTNGKNHRNAYSPFIGLSTSKSLLIVQSSNTDAYRVVLQVNEDRAPPLLMKNNQPQKIRDDTFGITVMREILNAN